MQSDVCPENPTQQSLPGLVDGLKVLPRLPPLEGMGRLVADLRRARKIKSRQTWALKNRQRIKQLKALWRAKNKERMACYMADWKIKNADHVQEYAAKYRQNHRQEMRLRSIEYYSKHKESCRTRSRAWSKSNPVSRIEYENIRRATKYGIKVDAKNVKQIIKSWKTKHYFRCYYCRARFPISKLHIDHVVPLIKGGKHSCDNICQSCPTCNQHKHTKLVQEVVTNGQPMLL